MADRSSALVIRLPRLSYLVVGFLAVGIAPVALYGGTRHPNQATISVLTLLYLVPILAAFYIARTQTFVNAQGIVVRALFGRRVMVWDSIRGLSVDRRSIYAVLEDGSAVRLPCVRIRDLAAISAVSNGRLPEIPEPRVIPAPGARRR